jgi:hypothetical protein
MSRKYISRTENIMFRLSILGAVLLLSPVFGSENCFDCVDGSGQGLPIGTPCLLESAPCGLGTCDEFGVCIPIRLEDDLSCEYYDPITMKRRSEVRLIVIIASSILSIVSVVAIVMLIGAMFGGDGVGVERKMLKQVSRREVGSFYRARDSKK